MAEENLVQKKQRIRSTNFSLAECEVLRSSIEAGWSLLTAKHCNSDSGVTKKMQDKEWEAVTSKVNSVGVAVRSVEEIKNKWRNLTKKSKTCVVAQKISASRTGGGPPIAPMDPFMEQVASMYADSASFHGVPESLDCETTIYICEQDSEGVMGVGQTETSEVHRSVLNEDGHMFLSPLPSTSTAFSSLATSTATIPTATPSTSTASYSAEAGTTKTKKSVKELQLEYFAVAIQVEKEKLKQHKAVNAMLPRLATVLDIVCKHFGEE